ncbi:MAG TPA: glycosyltransferase family 2 protein [Thermoanaerobaculia bacterium]|nr:glycosyltransferase family 2 protein [Thermoanaerobaculia bacterium]
MPAPSDVDRPFLSIVIPLFNEEENIVPLIGEIEAALPSIPGGCEVILVDDGSRDSSWERIAAAASERPWLRALRFLGNRGQTAAMVAGIDAARGTLVAFLDADLQNDPRDIARLVEPIAAGRADLVCGWRTHRADNPLLRTLPSRIANLLIRKSFDLQVHDLGCTLKVCRRAFLEEIQLYGEMHRFIPCYAQAQGARVTEVEVNHRPRTRGESKYGLSRVGKVLVDLATAKMLSSYGSKPAYFFGKIGLAFLTMATAAFALVAWRALVLGRAQATPMIFVTVMLFMTALVCFMSGLLAEISIRVLHQAGGARAYKVVERVGFDAEPARNVVVLQPPASQS